MEMIATTGLGPARKKSYNARFLPLLSQQSHSPIKATRIVRIIDTDPGVHSPIPV